MPSELALSPEMRNQWFGTRVTSSDYDERSAEREKRLARWDGASPETEEQETAREVACAENVPLYAEVDRAYPGTGLPSTVSSIHRSERSDAWARERAPATRREAGIAEVDHAPGRH